VATAEGALSEVGAVAVQLAGAFVLRPYVFGFVAIFLLAGWRDLGLPRTVSFLVWGNTVALVAELSSTRIGVPFGLYHYTGATRSSELFISNVPLFSPLSFPFLAYAGFCVARKALGPGWAATRTARVRTVLLSGALMTLLDVVIDPLAVRGGRWFLGHIFYYPDGGIYFGVPLSNFLGWLLVGWVTVGGYVWAVDRREPGAPGLGIVLFGLVLAVNLAVTVWIGELRIAAVGIVVHAATFLLLYGVNRVTVGRWLAEPISTPAVSGGGPTR